MQQLQQQHTDDSKTVDSGDQRLVSLEAERARLAAELDDARARLLLAQAEAGVSVSYSTFNR